MPTESPVIIPETITVHLGAPDSNAENITLSFPDYIKNVASSEIYPTWPEEAIRANIYAQVSYALNRVFTEWYRAQGYDFDITNSTAYDQSFVPNRSIFENISEIVEDMFTNYLTRGESVAPLFAQYCNGTTVTCEGLSQWGTVPLAEEGMSAEDIIHHFYGDDVNFVRNAPVAPSLGGSWPGQIYRLGNFNERVRMIQMRLNRISTNFPNIPKIYPVDGIFDTGTEEAVRAFQRQFNLTPDGIVGKATWYRIAFIYNNVKKLSELDSEALTISDVSHQLPTSLSEGSTGEYVELLQYILMVVGAFYNELPNVAPEQIDGVFGPRTRQAVISYQKMMQLPETGAIDRDTWTALVSTYRSVLKVRPPEEWLTGVVGFPDFFLVEGMSGDTVRQAQELINIIASVYSSVPVVNVDGNFGPETRDAISVIQSLLGQSASGALGPLTWEGMVQLADDIRAGSITNEGQYPGYSVGQGATS